jgi:hypothetical protein
MRGFLLTLLVVLGSGQPALAGKPVPLGGVLAASCGEHVVLFDPAGAWSERFESGPVGWLYPAPGGVLFAPDLVNGRTTVIDVAGRAVRERLAGVTMPHFGEDPDRYIVALADVMVFSYPERALIARTEAGIGHPWQVLVTEDQMNVLVLDRLPDRDATALLVVVDFVQQQLLLRAELAGDVHRMALPQGIGLLALADRSGGVVRMVDPATGATVAAYGVDGEARDVVAVPDMGLLAVAVASGDVGEIVLWKLKAGKKGLELKELDPVPLARPPQRIVLSPSGQHLAVLAEPSGVDVMELKRRKLMHAIELPGPARDLVWCDPYREGPAVPRWSDRRPPRTP